jgi:hypothetical protein
MIRSISPAHYLVFHPEKKRIRLKVSATALVHGVLDTSWSGNVWVDRPPGNEDPFVLGPSWAYSYCHATQLRRTPQREAYVRPGSCILFCSGTLADRTNELWFDTVFWIGGAHDWREKDNPPDRYTDDVASQSDLWKYHLRFGGQPGGHEGRYTYEAALFSQGADRYSRLPLGADGMRVRVPLRELPPQLITSVRNGLNGRKTPVRLLEEELQQLLQLVEARTAVAVVGGIVSADPSFMALRQEAGAGCHPCGRTSSSC